MTQPLPRAPTAQVHGHGSRAWPQPPSASLCRENSPASAVQPAPSFLSLQLTTPTSLPRLPWPGQTPHGSLPAQSPGTGPLTPRRGADTRSASLPSLCRGRDQARNRCVQEVGAAERSSARGAGLGGTWKQEDCGACTWTHEVIFHGAVPQGHAFLRHGWPPPTTGAPTVTMATIHRTAITSTKIVHEPPGRGSVSKTLLSEGHTQLYNCCRGLEWSQLLPFHLGVYHPPALKWAGPAPGRKGHVLIDT